MNQHNHPPVSRRIFLKETTTAAVGASAFTILKPQQVFAAEANSMIHMGIIGTGGRGSFDGRNLVQTNKVKVVALADYFDFQMKEPAIQFDVKPERCFAGIDGYKELLALEDVDAVLLTAAPYFRPMQFEAAIAAGKHVFAEKPVAVDAWGCRKFMEAGQKAAEKKLTVGAGLQSRYDEGRQKIAQLIQEGAIGKPLVGHSTRMGGDLWRKPRPAHFTERDFQIQHWLYYKWASGDFIVEMHIHNLDVFNWFTGMLPVSATGTGGRDVRLDVGDIFDHIQVLYEYPNGFSLTHTGTQIDPGYQGSEKQIIGTEGYYDERKGLVRKGEEPVTHGGMRDSTQVEMQHFVASVLGEGPYINNSDYVSTSTFMCVLGREAAIRRAKVRWDILWDSNFRIEMPV